MDEVNDSWLYDHIFDIRRKLLLCQIEQMILLREDGYSYRLLSKIFNVSKTEAYYICNPGAKERKVSRTIEWQKKQPVDLEKYRNNVSKSRQKKKNIISHFNKITSNG